MISRILLNLVVIKSLKKEKKDVFSQNLSMYSVANPRKTSHAFFYMRDTLQALNVDVVVASKYSFIQSAEESLIVANINFKRIWKFNMSPRPLSLLMSAS